MLIFSTLLTTGEWLNPYLSCFSQTCFHFGLLIPSFLTFSTLISRSLVSLTTHTIEKHMKCVIVYLSIMPLVNMFLKLQRYVERFSKVSLLIKLISYLCSLHSMELTVVENIILSEEVGWYALCWAY